MLRRVRCACAKQGSGLPSARVIVDGDVSEGLADALLFHGAVSATTEAEDASSESLFQNGNKFFSVDALGHMQETNASWKRCRVTALFDTETKPEYVEEVFRIAMEDVGVEGYVQHLPPVEEVGWMTSQTSSDATSGHIPSSRVGSVLHVLGTGTTEASTTSDAAYAEGAIFLHIEPAMAFGSGAHPTTRLCLEWLDENKDRLQGATVLDFGCGTGVLAIAALQLGAASVLAIDIDPNALEATRSNAELNGCLDGRLRVELGQEMSQHVDTCEVQGNYDVVVANVLLPPLLEFRDQIASWLKPSGLLCMSGILECQVEQLLEDYRQCFQHFAVSKDSEGKWARVVAMRK